MCVQKGTNEDSVKAVTGKWGRSKLWSRNWSFLLSLRNLPQQLPLIIHKHSRDQSHDVVNFKSGFKKQAHHPGLFWQAELLLKIEGEGSCWIACILIKMFYLNKNMRQSSYFLSQHIWARTCILVEFCATYLSGTRLHVSVLCWASGLLLQCSVKPAGKQRLSQEKWTCVKLQSQLMSLRQICSSELWLVWFNYFFILQVHFCK